MSRFSLWVGIRVHDNKLRPIPVHTGNPQQFAQRWLRNAGELARIDPSLRMAEFIGNSAILTMIQPSAVSTATAGTAPGREKWRTLP